VRERLRKVFKGMKKNSTKLLKGLFKNALRSLKRDQIKRGVEGKRVGNTMKYSKISYN
jgi:hypothetical protein